MPVGMQVIFGDESEKSGQVQIDDTYSNFHLRKSGVIKPSDWVLFVGNAAEGGRLKTFHININNFNEPIIVLRPLGDYTTASAVTYSKDSAGENQVGLYIWHNYEASADVEYYIFDNYAPPVQSLGLEIRNDLGDTVYHSSWYRLKVVGSTIMPNPILIGDSLDLPVPAPVQVVDKVALMMPSAKTSMLYYTWDSSYATVLRECTYFKSKSQVSVYYVPIDASNGWWDPSSGFWNKAPTVLLYVDVTGYPTNYTAP